MIAAVRAETLAGRCHLLDLRPRHVARPALIDKIADDEEMADHLVFAEQRKGVGVVVRIAIIEGEDDRLRRAAPGPASERRADRPV